MMWIAAGDLKHDTPGVAPYRGATPKMNMQTSLYIMSKRASCVGGSPVHSLMYIPYLIFNGKP